jgi:uncharacterized caspase-like protein
VWVNDKRYTFDPQQTPETFGGRELDGFFVAKVSNSTTVSLVNPGKSNLALTLRVTWRVDLAHQRTLYLLAVGVSDYQDKDLHLDYARDDATDLVKAFQRQKGALFKDVSTDDEVKGGALLDQQATKDRVIRALKRLQQRAERGGLAVIVFSGHGIVNDNGRFFFLPFDYDGSAEDPSSSHALSWDDIVEWLQDVRCPVLVLMDACHAGAVKLPARSRPRTEQLDPTNDRVVAEKLANSNDGIAILAACEGDKESWVQEEWKHGALSLALLEALGRQRLYKGKTPLPDLADGSVLTLAETRRYANARVAELTRTATGGQTRDEQTVVTRTTEGVRLNQFPLGKLSR